MSRSVYPYKGYKGKCGFKKNNTYVHTQGNSPYQRVGTSSSSIKGALAGGPVNVVVDSSSKQFNNYASGIFDYE
jgi:hypothetical protein